MSDPLRTEHRYVDTDSGQMHVVSVSSGQPSRTMVFIHQVPSSHMMWRAVMERLAVLGTASWAVDLPGFGFSERPSQPPSVEDYGRITAAAMRGLINTPSLVVGHHFGCVVAVELANQDPSLVHGVVGYGIPLVSEARRRELLAEEFEELSAEGTEVADYWSRRRMRGGASTEARHTRRALVEWLLAGDYAVWGHRAVGEYDTEAALRRLQRPLLGVAGDREDLYEETRRAAGEAAHGSFRALGSAGIDVADTSVHELCDVLVEFDDATRTPEKT